MSTPLISVITVCYNAVDVIESTIKSIIEQPGNDYEYIVIDGNSKDGTQAVVNKYIDKIDLFISEPDKGIPDALNKGVKLAKGKYVLFILGGDILKELPIESLKHEDADIVCYPVEVTGNKIIFPKIDWTIKIQNTIPHQGSFFKKSDSLVHDTKYRFFCDFAITQLYYRDNKEIKIFKSPVIAFHGLDGATSNKNNLNEIFQVVEDNFGITYKYLSKGYFKYLGFTNKLNRLLK